VSGALCKIERLFAPPVTITSLLLTAAVTVETDTNHYYLLLRGTNVAVLTNPVVMALSTGHTVTLVDTNRPPYTGFYRVEEVPLSQALDSDGDGMDDVFELTYGGCLNPFDSSDPGNDCDGDGLTNLQYLCRHKSDRGGSGARAPGDQRDRLRSARGDGCRGVRGDLQRGSFAGEYG